MYRLTARDLGIVAILLALGIVLALNAITAAVLWAALFHQSDVNGGISENATQVLTGWGGGIIGVLGAYVGYKAGQSNEGGAMYEETPQAEEQAPEEAPQEETLPLEEPNREAPSEEEIEAGRVEEEAPAE